MSVKTEEGRVLLYEASLCMTGPAMGSLQSNSEPCPGLGGLYTENPDGRSLSLASELRIRVHWYLMLSQG